MARLVFFGTPPLARAQLEALLRSGHEIALVVAQQDRPKGRGQKLEPPPTKVLALARGLEVAQPSTLKKGTDDGDRFFELFAAKDVDMAIVAAYGRIVPKRLLALPRRGFVNVHASLLPRWRGAAPIQRAIEAGDTLTGVCLMDMVAGLDEGDVFARAELPIEPGDDGASLTEKMATRGADLLAKNIDALLAGALPRCAQAAEGVTYAHPLTKEEGRINWSRRAKHVVDHARAMFPWPGSFTTLDGEVLKLFGPALAAGHGRPGEVLRAQEVLVVACEEGAVSFAEGQLPNKKRMPVADLVRGKPIAQRIAQGRLLGLS